MTHKATQDVVRRVMPLLERMATRTIDKARLLQYLSARAGADWGALELVADTEEDGGAFGATGRVLVFRDRATGAEHPIRYPACLPAELEPLVREEYKRLATDRRLTLMDAALFAHFFQIGYCDRCRWRGPEHEQIHRECRFAGRPINFELDPAAE
jgi:hypothetical protein